MSALVLIGALAGFGIGLAVAEVLRTLLDGRREAGGKNNDG